MLCTTFSFAHLATILIKEYNEYLLEYIDYGAFDFLSCYYCLSLADSLDLGEELVLIAVLSLVKNSLLFEDIGYKLFLLVFL